MTKRSTIRIGTRGSKLALAQAHIVRQQLMAAHRLPESRFEIVTITTSGDRIQDQPLADVGGKGLFTKEIEEALLEDRIDLAVHSMKDVATMLPEGLAIPCILEREDPRDAFISNKYNGLCGVPEGATFGTSSLRRKAQILQLRPDLRIVEFRGNVNTRLQKLADGVADATLLAVAGLNRLGVADAITALMDTDTILPAVAQGAVGIEVRENDAEMREFITPLHHANTALAITAERALLRVLDGSCRTPIAAYAEVSGDTLHLRGMLLETDGSGCYEAELAGSVSEAEEIGQAVGREILRIKSLYCHPRA